MLSFRSGNLLMCLKASDVGPGHNVQKNIFPAYEEGNGAHGNRNDVPNDVLDIFIDDVIALDDGRIQGHACL